jgi:hypothetical protein
MRWTVAGPDPQHGTALVDSSGNGYDGVLTGTGWANDTAYTPAMCGR